jgi:hypothetical protein
MKVDGVDGGSQDFVYGPLVFRRGPEKFLAFYAQPCWSLDEFHALCPLPENKHYVFTKRGKEKDNDSAVYKAELEKYYERRWGYVVMKTLEPSKIDWDTVNPSDPASWANVVPELKKTLSVYEYGLLANLINEANSLDQEKLEANLQSFFQLRAAHTSPNGQSGEAVNSNSSELVNASA